MYLLACRCGKKGRLASSKSGTRPSAPSMLLKEPVAVFKRKAGDVACVESPGPIEISPTKWDGKNRESVAIIVIDAGKKNLAYEQTGLRPKRIVELTGTTWVPNMRRSSLSSDAAKGKG